MSDAKLMYIMSKMDSWFATITKQKNNLLPVLFAHYFKLTMFQVLYVTVI